MTLCLLIKLINSLTVVYLLCVDLIIAKNHTLPNRFVSLFKVDVEELVVFNIPESVICLHFLAKLTLNKCLILIALECDSKTLGFDVYD